MKQLLSLAAILLFGGSCAWADTTYTVRQLFNDPPNQPWFYSRATAISNTGWVGAVRGQQGGSGLAYRCRLGANCVQVPFDGHGGGRSTVVPTDINDDGVIVGHGPFFLATSRGFKWDGVTITVFEPFTDECLGCQLSTVAGAINRRGEVAGQADGTDTYAVVFGLDNVAKKLPDLGGSWSMAAGMTNDGFVVGHAPRADGLRRGWVYDGAHLTELGTLGGSWSDARGVNEHRVVIGCSMLEGDLSTQGFVYQGGVTTPLPKLSEGSSCPAGINRHGHIVGYQRAPDGPTGVGTLFMRGRVRDLNRMLVKSERAVWNITQASAINGSGEIAATAVHRKTGAERAVVLLPVAP